MNKVLSKALNIDVDITFILENKDLLAPHTRTYTDKEGKEHTLLKLALVPRNEIKSIKTGESANGPWEMIDPAVLKVATSKDEETIWLGGSGVIAFTSPDQDAEVPAAPQQEAPLPTHPEDAPAAPKGW